MPRRLINLAQETKRLLGRLPKDSADACALWLKQNDEELRQSDLYAYEKLTPELRALVQDSPIQLACIPLLYAQDKWGSASVELALEAQLIEWRKSR